MRHLILVAAIGSLVLATPAWADYVDLSYSGTILQLAASGVPAGIGIGTPITFNVVFDPAKIVDYTASVNSSVPKVFPTLTNPNFFSSYQTVSLSDDPLASLTVTVGGITFNKFDGINYGTPCGIIPLSQCGDPTVPTNGLGGGNLPDVEYINGSLAGVGNSFLNSDGYVLDADPTADILDRASGSSFHVMGIGGGLRLRTEHELGSRPFAAALRGGRHRQDQFHDHRRARACKLGGPARRAGVDGMAASVGTAPGGNDLIGACSVSDASRCVGPVASPAASNWPIPSTAAVLARLAGSDEQRQWTAASRSHWPQVERRKVAQSGLYQVHGLVHRQRPDNNELPLQPSNRFEVGFESSQCFRGDAANLASQGAVNSRS